MKKILIILLITGLVHKIQCSYKSDNDLEQSRDDLQQQLILDLEYQHISSEGVLLDIDQDTLMDNFYRADHILQELQLENLSRRLFAETDMNTTSLIQRDRQIIALMNNGLSIYQAEDAINKNLNLEQALSAAHRNTLQTVDSLARALSVFDENSIQDFRQREEKHSTELRQTVIFFDAGLKLSQARLAAQDDLTVDEAWLMKRMLAERNGINGNNDGYKEVIAQIKNER